MSEKNISDKQLKIARWYLDNKKKFRKFFLIVAIGAGVIFWLVAFWQFVIYFTSTKAYEKMMSDFINSEIDYNEVHKRSKPSELVISNPILLNLIVSTKSDQKFKYDLGALVENPNINWRLSSISYYFTWDGGQSEVKENFILPEGKKYLLVLGQETEKKILNPRLIISNINWQRIKLIDDKRLKILPLLSVDKIDLSYIFPKEGIKAVPKISFQINNKSVYDFWQTKFTVILKQGTRVVGFNILTAKSWKSGEKRQMEILWTNIPTHDSIEVESEINVFDETVFLSNF